MTYTVITNNVPRFTIDAYELSAKDRAEFDYLNWQAIDNGEDSATFFRYKGRLYDLSEFSTTEMPFGAPMLNELGWHGFMADTYFSAIVLKFTNDNEAVIVGRVYS